MCTSSVKPIFKCVSKFFFIFIYSADNSNGTNLNTTDNPGYKILQNATYTPINDTFEFPINIYLKHAFHEIKCRIEIQNLKKYTKIFE